MSYLIENNDSAGKQVYSKLNTMQFAGTVGSLPFFSDPAAFALLLFGIATVVLTVGPMIYFMMPKKKKNTEEKTS